MDQSSPSSCTTRHLYEARRMRTRKTLKRFFRGPLIRHCVMFLYHHQGHPHRFSPKGRGRGQSTLAPARRSSTFRTDSPVEVDVGTGAGRPPVRQGRQSGKAASQAAKLPSRRGHTWDTSRNKEMPLANEADTSSIVRSTFLPWRKLQQSRSGASLPASMQNGYRLGGCVQKSRHVFCFTSSCWNSPNHGSGQ
eukprot:scaffold7768_cov277-Pinguiococcus_pyrenoidosus.AAC.2